jgi:peptidyl-prolyl cis-trans isomerase A (cyclophilin A)
MSNKLIVTVFSLCLGLGLTLGAGPAASQADDKHPVVVIATSMGEITVELDAEKAPITVENFLKYVDAKFYDSLVFHRIMRGFMIQGGGLDARLNEKRDGQRASIQNESSNKLSNARGTIAMARTGDPNSATNQFYINHGRNNAYLDTAGGGYTVFGKVIDGMDVVDKIANVETTVKVGGDGNRMPNVPVQPVTIKSVRRKAKS